MNHITDQQIVRTSSVFLRVAVILIGIVVLALCIFALPAAWQGVPAEYPTYTYVFYGIMIGIWAAAIPFFIALYMALKLLTHISNGKVFSMASVILTRRIAYCATAISLIYAAVSPFFYVWADNDDAPGLMVISIVSVVAPLTIAVAAAVLQRLLHEAVIIKHENELTV